MTGNQFGRLLVVGESATRRHYLRCVCSCGAEKEVYKYSLLRGASTSCGCFISEWTAAKNTTHGLAPRGKRPRTYNIWANMKARCGNPKNHKYPLYGARGIKVCGQWETFEGFLSDMGECPDGMSIDRIDSNGDYEPGNCRWADVETQANNIRTNVRLAVDGVSMTIAQWARRTGVAATTIAARVRRGDSGAHALREVHP